MRFQHLQALATGRALRPSAVLVGLVFGALSVVLAGCGSGSSPSAAPTTDRAATSTSTSQPPTGAAASALAAYRAMWANMVTASRTSDYQSPLLPEAASGEALSVLVRGLAKNQAQGIVVMGNPVLHPSVTSLTPSANPTRATIGDCIDDTRWLEYKASGGLVDSTPGGHHATAAIISNTDGIWKVTQLAVQDVGTC